MSFLWSIISFGWAIEGLDVVLQSPMSLDSLKEPWNMHINHCVEDGKMEKAMSATRDMMNL